MNYKIVFNEDYIITTIVFNLLKNYKYINKYGLIHLKHKKVQVMNIGKKKNFL